MLVAGPELVRAVPAQGHGDFFARDAGKQPGGRYGSVGHGHVHAADDLGQGVGALGGGEHALVVFCAVGGGGQAGVARFVVTGLAEADGKSLDRHGGLAGHKPGHNGGIYAA